MLIVIAITDGQYRDEFFKELCKRMDIQHIPYTKHLSNKIIRLINCDITISFKNTNPMNIRGYHPGYYYTDSFNVSNYFDGYASKRLKDMDEIVNVILKECSKKKGGAL